ncbi:MAG: Gfo/Idh/MocA family oxidoreductase, partial [Verrucomicrobiota bacterium]
MKTPPVSTRRHFLKNSAAAGIAATTFGPSLSAAEQKRVIGANDRIRIGQIGCGSRGSGTHMPSIYRHVEAANFEIVAIADPNLIAREKASAKVKEWFGREPKSFVSAGDLLALDDVDAVMIASPDHHHSFHLEAAARAGKHVYIEKPMAIEMEPLVRSVDAANAAGTIIQVGTQLRSLPSIRGAREYFRSGILGRVSRIDEIRNSPKPYWIQYLNPEIKKSDVDWKEFIGDRPHRPFRADVYSAWYGYYEFSQGPVPQWGAHFLDMVQFIADLGFPESCVCHGGAFAPKDEHEFTAPDQIQATWVYPNNIVVTSANNLQHGAGSTRAIYGEKGVLDVQNWNKPVATANGAPKRDGSIRGEVEIEN